MNRRRLTTMLTVAIVAVSISVISADESNVNPLGEVLGADQFRSCGLQKLSPREQRNLWALISDGPCVSYAEEAAVNHLKEDDWREIRVVGGFAVDEAGKDIWLLMIDQYQVHTLDPFITPSLPDPGIYLGRNIGTSWKILLPDGSEGSFTSREI